MILMTASAADPVGALICSRQGCTADATFGMLWNNPKLHTPARRKVWLTCPDHQQYFRDYLSSRGFLKDEVPVGQLERKPVEQ